MIHNTTWELYEMVQAFMQAPIYHLAFEGLLMMMVFWLLFHKSYKPELAELTEKEKEELIADWVPEPLVPDTPEDHFSLNPRTVTGKVGKIVTVDGKECLNMATHDYLSMVDRPELEHAAIKGLRQYGVGSCGPRGFYGTVDIHLDLEAKLANYMGVEEAVLYSYGFATISSAIPAYSKHGDVIFCDECVNFAIQKGLVASRSKICFFKHNDMEDLERLLLEQANIDKKNPKKAKITRRFLVVEGLYINYGDICPLPEIMKLKKKFKVRLFIDESCSFGVLGKTGRGITEYFDIPIADVDLVSGSLENAISSYGGFTCGTSFIVDHQRLSGLGYCFSASLPPLQAAVAMEALKILEKDPGLLRKLESNATYFHKELERIPQIEVSGVPFSPIKHVRIRGEEDFEAATKKLEYIVNVAMEKGVAFTVARYLIEEEIKPPPPSIRVIVSVALEKEEMDLAINVLKDSVNHFD